MVRTYGRDKTLLRLTDNAECGYLDTDLTIEEVELEGIVWYRVFDGDTLLVDGMTQTGVNNLFERIAYTLSKTS